MEIRDESRPDIAHAKLFNKRSDMKIRDESSDNGSDETTSLHSTVKKPKTNFSKYANPSKMTYEESENEDSEDGDLSSEDSGSDQDSGSYNSSASGRSARKEFTHRLSHDPQEGIKKRKLLIEMKVMERDHGIELSHGISEKSSLSELELEHGMHKKYIDNESTKEFYRMWIIQFANMVELITMAYNPMNVRLKNWSTNLDQNIHKFDEVLGELANKYGSGSTPPEIRLIFLLFTSASMYHASQKAIEMVGGNAMNNIAQAMNNTNGGNSNSGNATGGGMAMPDLSSLFGGGSGGGTFNPFEMLKAFNPSPPPSANERAQTQSQQSQSQPQPVRQMNSSEIQQNSIPNYGMHTIPQKPTGPLINPPKPINIDGFSNIPQSSTPDYVAQNSSVSRFAKQNNVPPSPSRFSVASSDSGTSVEISFKPNKGKKKTTSVKAKRGFKLDN